MKKLWIPAAVFFLAGIVMLCLPYYMEMTGLVLLLLGIAFGLNAVFQGRGGQKVRMCMWLLTISASVGVMVLMSCMSLVTCGGYSDWEQAESSDYAVVLGAAVQEDGTASRIMRQRLAAAMEFMARNPDAMVILSGSQGGNEPISEAQCMYNTLVEQGADPQRLLLEEGSENTRENLQNSLRIIEDRGGTKKPVAIITSEFHQRRAAYIGTSLGMETCPVSGNTDQWFYRINYTLREVFAFVKAAFEGSAD